MPTLWQKTTAIFIFENKGALYEQFPVHLAAYKKAGFLAMIIAAYMRLAEQNGGFPD
jgi:hypothetical protein